MDLTIDECSEFMKSTGDQPIWIAGHGTRLPQPAPMATLGAPSGVRSFAPEEMTLACGAATSIDELMEVLADRGQYVNLPVRTSGSGTVGGALAVGEGDVYRFGRGAVRDSLLQARCVDASGTIFTAGGPTVKNVSGFDLCRLLVGSCGRLGIIAEVILRTRPLPMATRWFVIDDADRQVVSVVMHHVRKPSSVLWTGRSLFVCVEGHPDDLVEVRLGLRSVIGHSVEECPAPNIEDHPYRWLCSPALAESIVAEFPGECVAEIGTGVIHHRRPAPETDVATAIVEIEQRLLTAFDPSDRLNGGSRLWGGRHTRRLVATS